MLSKQPHHFVNTEDTQVMLMNRLQCMRDNNNQFQDIIDTVSARKEECCFPDNVLTLQDFPITLQGDYLTLG